MKAPRRRPQKMKKTKIFAAAAVQVLLPAIRAALADKDLTKSIGLLHKVLEVNPRCLNTHLMIGRAHGMQYDYSEAVDFFERAAAVAAKDERSMVLIQAGIMARDFFDPTVAESLFEEAVEQAGSVSAKLALAEHCLRLRKDEPAATLVDDVLGRAPEDPHANFLWCRLNEDRFDSCMDRLKRIISTQTSGMKAKAGYQLAKMLDVAGDYNGAMQALASAKEVLMPARNQIVEQRRITRSRHMDLARGFTGAKRVEWQNSANQLGSSRKIALLGGHPRSGTTLLEQVLDSHPDIISAEEAENFNIFAFSPLMRKFPQTQEVLNVMDAITPADLQTARECYFSATDRCLGRSVGSRLLVDKNPSLTSLVPAMYRIFPEIKFVTMIRDPRDVILSCFMQSFVPVSGVNGNYLTLEDAAEEYVGVMNVWTEAAKSFEDNVCEIRYEDMVADLEGNARKVLDFLKMDWSESVMDYHRHAREKVVRSPTANAVTEKVHKRAINRWKNYEKHLEPIFDTLTPCLATLGYS